MLFGYTRWLILLRPEDSRRRLVPIQQTPMVVSKRVLFEHCNDSSPEHIRFNEKKRAFQVLWNIQPGATYRSGSQCLRGISTLCVSLEAGRLQQNEYWHDWIGAKLTKCSEGLHNKAFVLTMDNRPKVLARFPNPNASPACLTVASEITTREMVSIDYWCTQALVEDFWIIDLWRAAAILKISSLSCTRSLGHTRRASFYVLLIQYMSGFKKIYSEEAWTNCVYT